MKALCTCLLVLVVLFGLQASEPKPPYFEIPRENQTESGYIKLSWDWKPAVSDMEAFQFELQQAQGDDFASSRTIYQGQDYATFLSGLENGTYYFRVRAGSDTAVSNWSEPVVVTVQHHSLSLAFTLFGLGALVFLLTVVIVIQGNRKITDND